MSTVSCGEQATANVPRVCKVWPSHRLFSIFKASEMKMLKKKISRDGTVLLSYFLCPLFFPPVYFRGRRLCILQPTHRPPFCLAIAGKILSPPSPPSTSHLPLLRTYSNAIVCIVKSYGDTPLFVPNSFSVTCGGQNESRQKTGVYCT